MVQPANRAADRCCLRPAQGHGQCACVSTDLATSVIDAAPSLTTLVPRSPVESALRSRATVRRKSRADPASRRAIRAAIASSDATTCHTVTSHSGIASTSRCNSAGVRTTRANTSRRTPAARKFSQTAFMLSTVSERLKSSDPPGITPRPSSSRSMTACGSPSRQSSSLISCARAVLPDPGPPVRKIAGTLESTRRDCPDRALSARKQTAPMGRPATSRLGTQGEVPRPSDDRTDCPDRAASARHPAEQYGRSARYRTDTMRQWP